MFIFQTFVVKIFLKRKLLKKKTNTNVNLKTFFLYFIVSKQFCGLHLVFSSNRVQCREE